MQQDQQHEGDAHYDEEEYESIHEQLPPKPPSRSNVQRFDASTPRALPNVQLPSFEQAGGDAAQAQQTLNVQSLFDNKKKGG